MQHWQRLALAQVTSAVQVAREFFTRPVNGALVDPESRAGKAKSGAMGTTGLAAIAAAGLLIIERTAGARTLSAWCRVDLRTPSAGGGMQSLAMQAQTWKG
ncbi:hypothetical protein DJICPGNB_10185 [Escherichia coli]|nr:hypothetical protein DJICPGNB_10185 [Escherichia coli]